MKRCAGTTLLLTSLLLVAAPFCRAEPDVHVPLTQRWQFRQTDTAGETNRVAEWHDAQVPGSIHLDLLANKLIPAPFERDNEEKLQWIGDASWEYRTKIPVTGTAIARQHIDLVFDGLDSAAFVTLNGHAILQAENCFRQWRVDVKQFLHTGDNDLEIMFESPVKTAARLAATDRWHGQTPTADKTYLRKPAYEYGWDWGPKFVSSGISQEPYLELWDSQRVQDVYVKQRDISAGLARVQLETNVLSSTAGPAVIDYSWGLRGQQRTAAARATQHVLLSEGENHLALPLELANPQLWYPVGYGKQSLYWFKVVVSRQGSVQDQRTEQTGLRSIVLRRDRDQWGRSFEFVVNGIPVYAKGADVIPFDSFPARVDEKQYRYMLQSARDANMNMVRAWGGGYYESNTFYNLADELGIMIWQDFMFGNDWQPGTKTFRDEVSKEATYQVTRLRNHPSLVLWCGNNETEMSLIFPKNKMAKTLDTNGRVRIWQDYLLLFSSTLPDVVARLNPDVPYWPSSPSKDYEDDLPAGQKSGDSHDWSVWHGRVPFSAYEKNTDRFVSEYGFQSFPELNTVKEYTDEADRKDVFTPVMAAHQKSGIGNSVIHDYLLKDYSEPKDFEAFLYISQVLQAEGLKVGAEHLRRLRPRNMGSLFWQLNDCWPVASWSSIDYYGRWKALQYYARRFYAPTLVSPHVEDDALKVYIVSDSLVAQKMVLRVRLLDFRGTVLRTLEQKVAVPRLSSAVYQTTAVQDLLPKNVDPATVFVSADLLAEGTVVSSNVIYLVPTKQVHLPASTISMDVSSMPGGVRIAVRSAKLAKTVYLSLDKVELARPNLGDLDTFSDNYFDVLPNQSKEIDLHTTMSAAEVRKLLKVISVADAFPPVPQSAKKEGAN